MKKNNYFLYTALLTIAAIIIIKNRKNNVNDNKPQLIGQSTKTYIVKTHD